MAELDEPADENKIENKSQNNIVFFSRIINFFEINISDKKSRRFDWKEHTTHC